jgi:hypothetical protein
MAVLTLSGVTVRLRKRRDLRAMVTHGAVRTGLVMQSGGLGRGGWWARRPLAFMAAGARASCWRWCWCRVGLCSEPLLLTGPRAARAASWGWVAWRRCRWGPLSVISATLGSAEPGFTARRVGAEYRLGGGGVLAGLGARRVDLRAGGVSLSLTFVGLGRGARLSRPDVVSVSARANRVVYDRRVLREWYAAGPLGIEQGFTLTRRPAGTGGPVSLALGLAGLARAQQTGSRVRFLTRSGAVALHGGLSVTDAIGRPLRAALALHGATVLLRVWDRGARYPLRIDPLIQQGAKLTGSGESGAGYFGNMVALSADGNTAVIGAPGDNGGVGAAWVFTRLGSSWTQQAQSSPAATRPEPALSASTWRCPLMATRP